MEIYSQCQKCKQPKRPTRYLFCISCSHLGQSAWNKGLKGFLKGRKVSLETREKIGKAQRGKLNHNWKGGRTPKNQERNYKYWLWKEAVLMRDKNICSICGKFCMYPIAHHIISKTEFPEYKYDEANGKTLCYDCHRIIHHKVSYIVKPSEIRGSLIEEILSQIWKETSEEVQRILDETKELYSMSIIPARELGAKAKRYAELVGDYKK